jgi:hypothetical protein
MSYLDSLKQTTNQFARTENGAKTNASSLNPVLDFFALAGAMRGRVEDAVKLFSKAYAEDELLALRALFYLRDIRGGQGERDLFRACLKEVSRDALNKNLMLIPEYGRWDDILGLDLITIVDAIRIQLEKDEEAMGKGESVSLLAKWLPSENTSSHDTQVLAKKIYVALGLKPAQYRKKIVALRKHIKLLEQKMSAKQWAEIDYETVPSQAMRKHTKAFHRNDETRFTEFLGDVVKGEKKIKTSTLFTYEVFDLVKEGEEATADALWKNLPDYTQGNNALVIADVSGSMMGRPMSISVSLALYFAEHNTGAFKDYFMTFSHEPQLVKVLGKTLAAKLRNIENAQWDMNTNLESAFDAILAAAQKDKASADEIPKILYIISDMEFDGCVSGNETNLESAKRKFEAAGFTLPHVVFWNVDARNNQSPATMYDDNVTLISGSSASTFSYAVEGKSPLESMKEILNSERYAPITI